MTKEQERARAKRRAARQEAVALERAAQQRRSRQVAIVVAVLAVAIVGFVVLAMQLRDPDTDPGASPGSGTSSTSAADATTTAEDALADGCTAPPAVPGTAGELDAPSADDIAAVRGKTVVATIETNCGPIELTLDGAKAPETVASFAQLARLGYWADAPCHRLVTTGIFILQCGDPTGSGSGTPGYGYGIENAPADGLYPKGSVAMARTEDPNSNGGQYFLVYEDTTLPTDGGGYSIFGTVTGGLDIVERIAAGGNDSEGVAPRFPISTLTVTTETKD